MIIKNIVNNVKQQGVNTNPLWAYPIASELGNYSYKLVLQWTITCVEIYLSRFSPSNFEKIKKYIQAILDSEDSLSPSQCYEMGKVIWYSPERDDVQSAIARIWWMIRQFKLEEDDSGIMEATMVVGLLLPDTPDNDLLNKYLESAINTLDEKLIF